MVNIEKYEIYHWLIWESFKPAFNCSKLTIETLEQYAKYVQSKQ